MKPLAKSLHTVSVLVNLTRHLHSQSDHAVSICMCDALAILKLEGKPDTYDLIGQAMRQLKGEP